MDSKEQKEMLARWIMKTDQMQEALQLFRSSGEMTEEKMPEGYVPETLYQLIQGIIPAEADFQ